MTTLSVIMPVYNQQEYVGAAIRSILKQTYTDFEFIIVDDGSTDRTVEIIESFDDERIRLIRATHKGFIEALRLATREAQGKWLARMDSDDVCRPDRLERQLNFLETHPECVFVTSYYGIVTLNDKFLAPVNSAEWQYLTSRDITLSSRPFCDPGTVYDRRLALEIGYDDQFQWEKTLWYGLLTEGKGAVMEEPLYFVRWRMGSVSRGQIEYSESMTYEIHLKYDGKNAKQHRKTRRKVGLSGEKKCVLMYTTAGDFRAARTTAIKAWRRFPFRLETIKLVFRSFGIRRMKWVFGPASVVLFPSESPLKGS